MLLQNICRAVASLGCTFAIVLGTTMAGLSEDKLVPTEIPQINHPDPVSFEKEILPLLRKNCLACHNASDAESDLVLETPEKMLQGGFEGPAIVAGKGDESLIIKLGAHQKNPVMPPDNDVGAKKLTGPELALIKLWIDQGAKSDLVAGSNQLTWQPLPEGVNPIYTAAVSPDGQFAFASRANQVFVYHLPSKQPLGRLTDPALIDGELYSQPGVAHLDLVQAMDISPDGELLATGGFRNVKIWKKQPVTELEGWSLPGLKVISYVPEKDLLLAGFADGRVAWVSPTEKKITKEFGKLSGPIVGASLSPSGDKLVAATEKGELAIWNVESGEAIQAPVSLGQEVVAVTFGVEDHMVTAHPDNQLRSWTPASISPPQPEQPAEGEAKPEDQPTGPQPVKVFGGHTAKVTKLAVVKGGSQLVSASEDGTVRIWDLKNGNQIRSLSVGSPAADFAVQSDSVVATAVDNATVVVSNLDNGQEVAKIRADLPLKITDEFAKYDLNLIRRHVDLVKKDVEADKKRLEDEEKNQKTAMETLDAAKKEMDAKTEAAKKPLADLEAAEKELPPLQEQQTAAMTEKEKADAELKTADDALTKARADQEAANKTFNDANTAFNNATNAKNQAQAASDGDKENADLKAKLDAAVKALQDAENAKKQAEEKKAAADKAVTDADNTRKEKDEARKTAEQKLNDLNNKVKQAEDKIKNLSTPATKARDERDSAIRAHEAAQRSVERADQSVATAKAQVPQTEALLKNYEQQLTQQEAAAKAAAEAVNQPMKAVAKVAVSPAGWIAAIDAGNQLLVAHAETGQVITLHQLSGPVANLVFVGEELLTFAADGKCTPFHPFPTWVLEKTIGDFDSPDKLVDRVTAIDFSPDGQQIVTGGGVPSRSGELKIWDVASGNQVREFVDAHSDTVLGAAFSPDGKTVASCGADRFMKTFSVSDGKFIRAFEGHTHHVVDVAWQADGRELASAGADSVVKVWNAITGDQIRTIQGFKKEVTAVDFRGIGDELLTASGDANVSAKRTSNGGNVRGYGGLQGFVYAVAATRTGTWVIAGGADSHLRIWNENGQLHADFAPPEPETVEPGAEASASN